MKRLARSSRAASRVRFAYENESIDVTGSGQAWLRMGITNDGIGTRLTAPVFGQTPVGHLVPFLQP